MAMDYTYALDLPSKESHKKIFWKSILFCFVIKYKEFPVYAFAYAFPV